MKHIKKSIFVLAFLMLWFLVVISPAKAISYGELDGDDHPYVGLVVADDADGNPQWRGSGTLIAPRVFLTAGHVCEMEAGATIWFQSDVESGIPDNGYPFGVKKYSVDGICYTHPEYDPYGAWWLHDIGVVILDKPVKMKEYGVLPDLGILDEIESSDKEDAFTAVGYGLQYIVNHPFKAPRHIQANRVRYQTTLNLVNLDGTTGIPAGNVVIVSGNTNTGGTCFGDSGGPLLLEDSNTIAAVISFGMNANCAGIGGANRIDTADDLAWITSFL